MKRHLLSVLLCCVLQLKVSAQLQNDGKLLLDIDSTKENMHYWNSWLQNLYDRGIRNENDTFKLNQEVIRLIKDSVYRKLLYPETYSVTSMIDLMKKKELKNAFWYMINLYQDGDTLIKYTVLRTILAYDRLLEMDKVLVSAFYTYSFLDPAVTKFINGKPVITRPDLLEIKFSKLKEIINYITAYRKLNSTHSGDR